MEELNKEMAPYRPKMKFGIFKIACANKDCLYYEERYAFNSVKITKCSKCGDYSVETSFEPLD